MTFAERRLQRPRLPRSNGRRGDRHDLIPCSQNLGLQLPGSFHSIGRRNDQPDLNGALRLGGSGKPRLVMNRCCWDATGW